MALSLHDGLQETLRSRPIVETEVVLWFFFTELPTPSPSLALLERA
jgi:hypothetical protein